jgi:hypothetical protein
MTAQIEQLGIAAAIGPPALPGVVQTLSTAVAVGPAQKGIISTLCLAIAVDETEDPTPPPPEPPPAEDPWVYNQNIFHGAVQITDLQHGSAPIAAVFYGSTLIWTRTGAKLFVTEDSSYYVAGDAYYGVSN